MSLDLVLHAAGRATLATFARTYPTGTFGAPGNLQIQDAEGNWSERHGLEWSWWNGTGKIKRESRQLRTSQPVSIVQDPEFGFQFGNTPPAWVDSTVRAYRGEEEVGAFDRIQGQRGVFTLTAGATLPTVDEVLDLYSGPLFVAGEAGLLRIHSDFWEEQRFTSTIDDEGQEIPVEEQDRPEGQIRVARFMRKNGTPITIQGINGYELDGVRVFKYADVQNKCRVEWGTEGHMFL